MKKWERVPHPEWSDVCDAVEFTDGKRKAMVTYRLGTEFRVNIYGIVSIDVDCDQDMARFLKEPTPFEGALHMVLEALNEEA